MRRERQNVQTLNRRQEGKGSFLTQQGLVFFLSFALVIFKIDPNLGQLHETKLYKATIKTKNNL